MTNILIAEDERMMRKAILFRLQKEGYTVTEANDGKEALELIDSNDFDLVIADIMMPYASGLEVVEHIQNMSTNKKPKVILLSALGQENIVLKAFALGADDYMTKPFSPNELMVRVKKLLN